MHLLAAIWALWIIQSLAQTQIKIKISSPDCHLMTRSFGSASSLRFHLELSWMMEMACFIFCLHLLDFSLPFFTLVPFFLLFLVPFIYRYTWHTGMQTIFVLYPAHKWKNRCLFKLIIAVSSFVLSNIQVDYGWYITDMVDNEHGVRAPLSSFVFSKFFCLNLSKL